MRDYIIEAAKEDYYCIDCRYFRWCKETGEGYCYNTGCDVDSDSSACDRFIRDDDY